MLFIRLELSELMHFLIQLILVRIEFVFISFNSLLLFTFLATQVRTRSARNDLSSNATSHDSVSDHNTGTISDRRTTATSRKSVRSQRTIATSATDMSRTSSKVK